MSKIKSQISRIPSKIESKIVPHSGKIDLWSCLGALWAPSCRQDGTRSTPRANKYEKNSILEWQMESKMELKSFENLINKITLIFITISKQLFSILERFWLQKPFQNEGSHGHFFNLVTNMRKLWFLTTLQWFCFIVWL